LLETANIKLASVATDVFGVSGRLMLEALVEENRPTGNGELAKDVLPERLTNWGQPWKESSKNTSLPAALQLHRLEAAEKDLAVLEQRLQEKLKPYEGNSPCLAEIRASTGRWLP